MLSALSGGVAAGQTNQEHAPPSQDKADTYDVAERLSRALGDRVASGWYETIDGQQTWAIAVKDLRSEDRRAVQAASKGKVRPHTSPFGAKDYQQFGDTLRRMIEEEGLAPYSIYVEKDQRVPHLIIRTASEVAPEPGPSS